MALWDKRSPKTHDLPVCGVDGVQETGNLHPFLWYMGSALQLTKGSVPEMSSSPHFPLYCRIPCKDRFPVTEMRVIFP